MLYKIETVLANLELDSFYNDYKNLWWQFWVNRVVRFLQEIQFWDYFFNKPNVLLYFYTCQKNSQKNSTRIKFTGLC